MRAGDCGGDQSLQHEAGDGGVAAREHLIGAAFVFGEGMEHFEGVVRVGGERVGTEARASTFDGREERANYFAREAEALDEVLFESDGVEVSGDLVAFDAWMLKLFPFDGFAFQKA